MQSAQLRLREEKDEQGVLRSRPQSCDPFGQRHGSRGLAGSEAGSPRISDFRLSAQPQKFETTTVTISYKNGQLLRLRVILAPARALDPWRWPKESQFWGRMGVLSFHLPSYLLFKLELLPLIYTIFFSI